MLLLLGVWLPVHRLLLGVLQRPWCMCIPEPGRLRAGLLRLNGQLRAIPQVPGQVRMLQEGLLRCRELCQVRPQLVVRSSSSCRLPLHGCARMHTHTWITTR